MSDELNRPISMRLTVSAHGSANPLFYPSLVAHPEHSTQNVDTATRRVGSLSNETNESAMRIAALVRPASPGALTVNNTAHDLKEALFEATASAKILTSQVAMHLTSNWRQTLFKQLDSLHDIAEWQPEDRPVQQASFFTFLRAICQIMPQRIPGLGLSSSGHVIAAWMTCGDRLVIEFLPNDRIRWVASRNLDEGPERVVGQTSIVRLLESLSPYDPKRWFTNEASEVKTN
jgi:hypothetical protein